ncbi:hybrid sensor histidine kinase/response regulator [Brevundimonas sp. LM2]|uniref:ATP-binding protein n=1 Tax=Brevundimonas sp. LM2 TaxID=1938605 RepID=UPI0009839964|nr:ATP-binding protein [Brevundimonas sp. LM2]AQR62870.1 hybrid sensor histidine kinase/response regulator [Brevundimonas sp. LM2]
MLPRANEVEPGATDIAGGDIATFFDVSIDLLVIRDLRGIVVKVSPSWSTTLGYHPSEMVGRPLLALVHPDDLPVTWDSAREVETRRPGDPVRGQINRYRHKDGHYLTMEWRAQRRGDHVYGVARDVTARVAAEAELLAARTAAEAANRAKSDFLANMSHEIRTPLNGVIGIVDSLSRTHLDGGQTEMVGLIRESGATLERLVSDILDMSKIEAGKLDLELHPFDLEDALSAPIALNRGKALEKGLAFVVDIAPEACGTFLGDSTRLRQVVGNLLSNAVKFTAKGRIVLTAWITEDAEDQAFLSLTVQDSGVGFDEHQAALLFGRFNQADGTIARRFGGTGLGLSICRSLMRLMGGDIEASSEPGVGSRFSIKLPLPRVAQRAAAPRPSGVTARSPLQTDRPLRILLAEDHPTNQRVVQLILDGIGADLVIVDDGARALAAAMAGTFDVILMDMQMPGMDGLTATRAIRSHETLTQLRTPIVMLSANAMAEHKAQACDAGADLHVPKPITAAALLAGIETVLAG